jgi:hypothetical protein
VTGKNLSGLTLVHLENGQSVVEDLTVSNDKTSASWTGNIPAKNVAYLKRVVDGSNKTWLSIYTLNEGDEWSDVN